MQHQLHVILTELQKARNQITQLESLVSLEWLKVKLKAFILLSLSAFFPFIHPPRSCTGRVSLKEQLLLYQQAEPLPHLKQLPLERQFRAREGDIA